MTLFRVACGIAFFWWERGNAGTSQQRRGLQRSHLLQMSGNVGTQLCSINNQITVSVPTKKTLGTERTSETCMVTGLFPLGHVPTDFEIRRVNKGGVRVFC
ncbi:hypothetical protein D9M70_562930 [compost metagenome]